MLVLTRASVLQTDSISAKLPGGGMLADSCDNASENSFT